MRTYYFLTSSKDRIGCRSYRWHVTEANTKTEVKKRFGWGFYGTIQGIYTEEQLNEHFDAETIKKQTVKR